MVEREYFHYPVKERIEGAPLQGIVTCVSGYSGKERVYINTVIDLLGGNPQVGKGLHQYYHRSTRREPTGSVVEPEPPEAPLFGQCDVKSWPALN